MLNDFGNLRNYAFYYREQIPVIGLVITYVVQPCITRTNCSLWTQSVPILSCERRGGVTVSALDSSLSGQGSSPG